MPLAAAAGGKTIMDRRQVTKAGTKRARRSYCHYEMVM
jgi:hypothetical protein